MTVRWTLDPETHGVEAVLDAAEKALQRTVLALEGFVKAILTGQRHGRVYRRGRRVHVASAPGEPPATDTGLLRNSVQASRRMRRTVRTVIGEVGIGAAYALFLEKGTRRMKPRPFIERTLKDKEKPLFELFSKLFRGYLG